MSLFTYYNPALWSQTCDRSGLQTSASAGNTSAIENLKMNSSAEELSAKQILQDPDVLQSVFSSPDQLAKLVALRGEEAAELQSAADKQRRRIHGDVVFMRGIIEFSNYCRNHCLYCGIRADNKKVTRYRMSEEAILETAANALKWGCTTVVLQSGDDPGYGHAKLAGIIRRIRNQFGLVVTLSLGTLSRELLEMYFEAGAERYLLRFESSNPQKFASIHPDETLEQRLQCLADLRSAGYQVGSGFMIALPGWTPLSIAQDIILANRFELDMIGCGPFLAHPDTPLAGNFAAQDRSVYYNTIALLRLGNPRAHIPATTAFDALEPEGRTRVMECGANVFMPNLTPIRYRLNYQLYPGKPSVDEDGEASARLVRKRLEALGRTIGTGPGHALKSHRSRRS